MMAYYPTSLVADQKSDIVTSLLSYNLYILKPVYIQYINPETDGMVDMELLLTCHYILVGGNEKCDLIDRMNLNPAIINHILYINFSLMQMFFLVIHVIIKNSLPQWGLGVTTECEHQLHLLPRTFPVGWLFMKYTWVKSSSGQSGLLVVYCANCSGGLNLFHKSMILLTYSCYIWSKVDTG